MTAPPGRIARFGRAERALHWLLAGTFLVMLGTGLVMSVPALSQVATRPDATAWHLRAAWALVVGTVLLLAARWAPLRRTIAEFDRFDADDLRWLREAPRRLLRGGPAPPQGRFNAGQKLNAALVGGLMGVAYVSGLLLWLGERDTAFRLDGSITVHDAAMWALAALVAGHVWMALGNPATRPALDGMLTGDVDRDWAAAHHARWVAADGAESATSGPPPVGSGSPDADVSSERRDIDGAAPRPGPPARGGTRRG